MEMQEYSMAAHDSSVLKTYCGSVWTMKAITDSAIMATTSKAIMVASLDDAGSFRRRHIDSRRVFGGFGSAGSASDR